MIIGVKGKGSLYLITERRVPELIPVLDSQPAGDMSHKPGGRLPLLFARPTVKVSQCTKFEVSRFTRYEAMNGSAKCRKWGG